MRREGGRLNKPRGNQFPTDDASEDPAQTRGVGFSALRPEYVVGVASCQL